MRTTPAAPGRRHWIAAITSGLIVGTAVWLSFGALALTDATGASRIGLVPGLSVWLASITLASAAIVSTARWNSIIAPLLLCSLLLLPWLPFPVPDVFLTWTGPVTRLVWSAAVLCMLARVSDRVPAGWLRVFTGARTAPRIACALAFLVFLAVRARQDVPPSGDEPHYLLIAQSLIADHDLKVENNYQDRSYSTYYSGRLWPHYSRRGVDGALYSLHAPGLPALIAPAFAMGGYSAVVVWIAAIAALGSLFVWKAAHALTGDPGAAWFAWAAAALTSPMAIEGTLVYPDAVAGTALSAGVLAMVTARSMSSRAALGTGVAIAILPWLHTRFALPAALMLVIVLCRIFTDGARSRWWRPAVAITVPVVVSVMAWLLFFFRVYGSFSPGAAYENQIPLEPRHVLSGALGMIADQEFGLVANAPVHLLWAGGLWTLLRAHKRLVVELAAIAVPYAIAVAGFPNWWGGSTAARYLAPLVFPLAITIAPLWRTQDAVGRSMSGALLVVSVLIASAFAFGETGSLAYAFGEGRSRFLDWVAPLVNLPAGFPSYFRAVSANGDAHGSMYRELVLPAGVWSIALGATWICSRWLHARPRMRAIHAPAVAAGCLFTAFTLGVTCVWWIAGVPHLTATRAQLAVIARAESRLTPIAIRLGPVRAMSGDVGMQQLMVSTSYLDTPPAGALLFLREVPPGEYRVRRRFASLPRGELRLFVGRAAGPIAQWGVSAPDEDYTVRLPVRASVLTIVGDGDAAGSLRRLSLVPVRHITTRWANSTRARDAMRYGKFLVYAIDDRVLLQADGFWVLGGRQPDVVFDASPPSAAVRLEVRNVATPNVIRVSTGAWSVTKSLAPDERWPITVPLDVADSAHVVNFRVEQGARSGAQFLGCRVTVVEQE